MLILLAGQALTASAICAASAQIVIIASDVPELPVNRELKGEEKLKIPERGRVLVLTPSATTIELKGPLDESVSKIVAGQTSNEKLFAYVRSVVLEFFKRDSSRPAATKGLTGEGRGRLAVVGQLSWSTIPIPVESNGTVCILKNETPRFARLGASPRRGSLQREPTLRLSTRERVGQEAIIVKWQLDEEEASLPGNVSILPDVQYDAAANFAQPSHFKIKFLDKSDIDNDASLFERGCLLQLRLKVMTKVIMFAEPKK
jgi:hypothetical protein